MRGSDFQNLPLSFALGWPVLILVICAMLLVGVGWLMIR